MHAVMRNYSGKGAKELFDVIEKNEALKNHSPVNTSAEHCRRKLQSGILATEADFQEVAKICRADFSHRQAAGGRSFFLYWAGGPTSTAKWCDGVAVQSA